MFGLEMWSYSSKSEVNFALILCCLGQSSRLQSVLWLTDVLVAWVAMRLVAVHFPCGLLVCRWHVPDRNVCFI